MKLKILNKWWRIWAKSLGEKVGETDKQANVVAGIRTFWWLVHIFTCFNHYLLCEPSQSGWLLVCLQAQKNTFFASSALYTTGVNSEP